MSYQEDRVWSDRFIPCIKRLVGPHLLEPSSFEVDTKQAADLVVLTAKNMTIACRVRRHGYADKYRYEFTVRSARDSGARTELEKLTDGWGDWMFYGHAAQSSPIVERWWLIDLSAWRAALIRDPGSVVKGNKSNGDGTHFVYFDVRSFKDSGKPLLVAASHPLDVSENDMLSGSQSFAF